MPPRSAKKSMAKKPSPKVPPASKPSPEVPPPIVEVKMEPESEAASGVVQGKTVPLAESSEADTKPIVKMEDPEVEAAPPAAIQEGRAPKLEVGEEVARGSVDGDAVAEKVQDSSNRCSEAAVSMEDQEVPDEGREADDGDNEMDTEEGVETAEQETGEGEIEDTAGGGADGFDNVDNVAESIDGNNRSGSDDNADNEVNDEDDPSIHMQPSLMERKKQKEIVIFIGGLDKEAVEDDLIKVFGVFGEIQSVKIVKTPSTQKSRGFAFIRYATIEQAKKALIELKDGTEVRGKRARVSAASQDNDTLYLRNICKTWTRDHVIETLKGFGVEHIEHMVLPDDPKNEGKYKGFAFLEFGSNFDAKAAFQRLRKPDAVFGCDRSAKVSFATSMHPSEEYLLQATSYYLLDRLQQYGDINKVLLSRNFSKTKRKDFGFIEFTSPGSALACVKGINNAQFGEGETKVKANLAKPQNKGRFGKQGAQGGFQVKKDGETIGKAGQSKNKTNAKSKEVTDKGKSRGKVSQPSKSQGTVADGRSDSQAAEPVKGKKRDFRSVDTVTTGLSSKKARFNSNYGKMRGRPSSGFRNQRNTYSGMPQANYMAHPTAYAPIYVPSAASYEAHAFAGTSGPRCRPSDLEPHGGYIPAAKQVRIPYGNEQRRAGAYGNQPSSGSGYAGAAMVPPYYPAAAYPSYPGYEAGYAYRGYVPWRSRRGYYWTGGYLRYI